MPKNFQLGFRLSKFNNKSEDLISCAFRENWGKKHGKIETESQKYGKCYKIPINNNKQMRKYMEYNFNRVRNKDQDNKTPRIEKGNIMGTEILKLEKDLVFSVPLAKGPLKNKGGKSRFPGSFVLYDKDDR